MAETPTLAEPEDNLEKNSRKTVKFWLPESKEGRGEYIGEIYVENGQFVALGKTTEDTSWLDKKLQNIWVPQRGIPIFKKNGAEFEKDANQRYKIDSYRNHGNCTADELLDGLYDYVRSMVVFKVSFEDRKT
jgi:hypothetical protein